MNEVRIRDVAGLAIRREDDSIGLGDSVGDEREGPRVDVQPPHTVWQLRGTLEALLESVIGVGEEDGVGLDVHSDVVEGVELSAEEIVENGLCSPCVVFVAHLRRETVIS